ncbi:hypothetical protein K3495_g11789 [Podosphaera aphanis]|nr:hypothetical protein K3495_g11789 [Podosphaera aphanis]
MTVIVVPSESNSESNSARSSSFYDPQEFFSIEASNADPMDPRLNGQQNPPPPLTLSQDQLNELLSFIRTQNTPKDDEPRAPPQQPKNKPLRWPEWDCAQNTYSVYIDMLSTKIDEDWEILGGHKAVCNEIMNTIPADCRLRVSHWFSCGGPKRNWDYKKFIEHLNENLEDKTSTRTASFTLAKMRQGKYQPFSEYLRDFEYTLAQAKGLNWEDRIKFNDLYRGLNDRLTRALFPNEVSERDYTLFVNQQPQSLTRTIFDENYSAPRNSTVGNREALGSSCESNSTMLDSEEDTLMSGVNGISIEKLAALVNAVNAKSNGQESNKNERPPAPWRSPEEFSALRAAVYVGQATDWTECHVFQPRSFVKHHKLPQIPIETRELKLAKNEDKQPVINEVTYVDMDIDGRNERLWGYVIQGLAYDMILGDPWMRSIGVVYNALGRFIRFGPPGGLVIRPKGWDDQLWYDSKSKLSCLEIKNGSARQILGGHFAALAARIRNSKDKDIKLFAASIEDKTKALKVKSKQTLEEIRASLPQEIRHNAQFFTEDEKLNFPPHRPGADTKIDIIKDKKGREKDIPWGPLYNMSREELLVLRKTLTDHLGKNWIRASSSPSGAPVLFVKKPGGGLRFCADYRALNAITVKDRYPLPLIKETLRQVARATWVSKVDVRAAFHKLRIREGDEPKTVSRTRYGLFEWLVTPFGLTGAPGAFQRYINSVLGEFLGDFCSAYLDDVLIYTTGDIADHWTKVNQVLQRLDDEKDTVLEADCSGYVIGGCLSQKDEKGYLRPVAYFSKKLSPAEANYDIHDKELLAIVRCMEEWRGMLIGLDKPFVVLSDHQNLKPFMTTMRLNERQGRLAARPDALSRREQDMPQGIDDDRIKNRELKLIQNTWISAINPSNKIRQRSHVTQNIPRGHSIFTEESFQILWDRAVQEDDKLQLLYDSVVNGDRSLPSSLSDLKVSLAECGIDARGALVFRNRTWIPNFEPLQTSLIQKSHDSHVTGHPGRDSTLAILNRSFFFGQGCRNMFANFAETVMFVAVAMFGES